ncbi:hypothetical protein TBLA_0F02330 [Henningerozyma blattae CBS 6284]|uniref:DNA damage-binding protein CMR1 n=1 Tax=Henningerozyma blattae (strain ATCC 34711 / CBS 6284 / DSM 70876 / NBRC 10599 / NRRL Y-10934 / UCD 77-7) TaxID=1071380 RepID=I2H5X2_HENB6|nr:hypothetical protein TBLA_0F02330 [Tetrapisispora blattae CBS 6284]CCH61774.1 hypothetical protein TBLA_0F02330 [Tetrapisispora blattae CBS 6284]
MVELTEFQKKRLENIKRNNDILKKLSLTGTANQIKKESGIITKEKKKTIPARSIKKKQVSQKPPPIPTRRSRRLRGETVTTEGIPNLSDSQLLNNLKQSSPSLESDRFESLIDDLKESPVVGDIKLSDIIKDENESSLQDKFKYLANKNFSSGDFFEELKKYQTINKPELSKLQEDFDLQLYDIFQPNEIKIVYERISSVFFHPSIDKKLIIAGDKVGNLGFWNVRDEPLSENGEDDLVEPDITRVKLFTKNVSEIDCFPTDLTKILTTSYDGTIRSIDLNTMESNEILQLKDVDGNDLGISAFQFNYSDPNQIYLTTLSGEFTTLDIRMNNKNLNLDIKRLSNKKIGSFAINPKRSWEIATGSLDRTLKIWDIRKIVKEPEWSQYDDYESHQIIGTYDSRLSISAISYSPFDNTLVCNGYDDTIRLFDVNENNIQQELTPKITIKHNCQTGRWTSILKAKYKPNQNVFGIANMGKAIDLYDSEGQQLAHLKTATVPAVIAWHPINNWIAGGNSSGKIFLFTDENRVLADESVKVEGDVIKKEENN